MFLEIDFFFYDYRPHVKSTEKIGNKLSPR